MKSPVYNDLYKYSRFIYDVSVLKRKLKFEIYIADRKATTWI